MAGHAAPTTDAPRPGDQLCSRGTSGGLYEELLRDATGTDATVVGGDAAAARPPVRTAGWPTAGGVPHNAPAAPPQPAAAAEEDSALATALLADAESQRMRELSDDTALALALSLSAAETGACR